jgi:hypothetical protein
MLDFLCLSHTSLCLSQYSLDAAAAAHPLPAAAAGASASAAAAARTHLAALCVALVCLALNAALLVAAAHQFARAASLGALLIFAYPNAVVALEAGAVAAKLAVLIRHQRRWRAGGAGAGGVGEGAGSAADEWEERCGKPATEMSVCCLTWAVE